MTDDHGNPASDSASGPTGESQRVALCLSGGGYRAALFHLGALRRLNELGVLSDLDTITSVSGGSIMAAHLARCVHPWPSPGTAFADWESKVAAPFRAFVKHDIRTGPVLKRYLLPWHWPVRSTQVKALEAKYYRLLTQQSLIDLPERPNFVFCATDISHGINWVFERTRVGDYKSRYTTPDATWPVARAVAASSCFPPVFDPMSLDKDWQAQGTNASNPGADATIKPRLSDGGVYDNMGLEPAWKRHAAVIVSDGGAPFRPFQSKSPFRLWMRYFGIASNQVGALRKRWLVARFQMTPINGVMPPDRLGGTYWDIGNGTKPDDNDNYPSYTRGLAQSVISRIRTDLDRFTGSETAVLENHGYLLANATMHRHATELMALDPPIDIPHAEMMDESVAARKLEGSDSRISLKRLFGGG